MGETRNKNLLKYYEHVMENVEILRNFIKLTNESIRPSSFVQRMHSQGRNNFN
jgi:hypothetical protein